ncbi:hypothetical protein K491DRAFT_692542 [Lophiostoma macrostomum CBS 122681]|uniref:EthD domain-containing protein n=1 Tax=Lophiostoma macrostomum CBS 122681 TaxID=1314788 RepID=A0A6A6TBD3_9PLEO|nr:hypothetical protein K491DRAFT_692542 [Lophiostoma macrostomum CBS 122681]
MTFTVFLFLVRKPTLSPEQFTEYYETTHISLLRSLVGQELMPPHFTRQYFARTYRQGFGGPANRNNPLLMLRGNAEEFEYDAMAQMTWECESLFQKFYKAIYERDAAAKIAADEDHFLEPGTLKAVVVGETIERSGEVASL